MFEVVRVIHCLFFFYKLMFLIQQCTTSIISKKSARLNHLLILTDLFCTFVLLPYHILCCYTKLTKPLGVQASIFGACPKPDKLGGLQQERHLAQKRGDDGAGSLISRDGVTRSQTVGASASLIFPCTIKPRRRLVNVSSGIGSPR